MRRLAVGIGLAICLSAGMLIAVRAASSSGLWTTMPAVPSPHQGHRATLLLDGSVLVTGGLLSTSLPLALSSAAELYRPETDDWLPVRPMLVGRFNHGAALLTANGKVLVAGGDVGPVRLDFSSGPNCGSRGGYGTTFIAELFDPSNLTWSLAPPMHESRGEFTLVRLSDGRILAAGGTDSRQAEIYDPLTNAWTLAESMHSSRARAAYTLMFDGRVMVAGGNYGAIWPFCDTTAEIYDPQTNQWTSTHGMAVDRVGATATLIKMPDGTRRVLVAGGLDNLNGTGIQSSAELYDPATDEWTLTGSMTGPRTGHTATLMGDGRVLVTGGVAAAGGDLASAEIYDPATQTWMTVNGMSSGRSSHTATLLLNPLNEVAVIGGSSGTTTAELFQPTPIGSNTFLSVSACQPLTLTATVSSASGRGAPTGTVTFKEGATLLGFLPPDQFGEAQIPFGSPFPAGLHTFTAEYSGDDAFEMSTGTVTEELSAPLTVSIGGNFPPQAAGTSVTLTASVSSGTGPFTYTWRRNGSTIASSSSASVTDTPPLGENTYEVVVNDGLGCFSQSATKKIEVYDFSISVNPGDLTLLRRGDGRPISVSVTLAAGSSTVNLPATVTIRGAVVPEDLSGLTNSSLPLPQTPGSSVTGTLTLAAGATSLGDFAVTVRAIIGNAVRSAPLNLHLYDFDLSVAPASATGYRSGFSVAYQVTSNVTPGSTSSLPGPSSISVTGLPSDATFTASAVALNGAGSVSIQPGANSIGTFPLTISASSAGTRSAGATLQLVADATPPTVTAAVNGTPGTNGWYISDVSVSWVVSDSETPITSTSGCAASSISSDTAATSFTCTAMSGGGTTTKSVVIKRDVSPPTLSLVSPAPVNADQLGGAIVTFPTPARDNVDPNPTAICMPLSGSLFPAGQTTVRCTATNAAGLSSSGTLTVTVVGSIQQTSNLIAVVASLPAPPGGSLGAKLQQILATLTSGDTAGACTTLKAFVNEVNGQTGKSISAADAAKLIQAAETIETSIGCS